MKKSLTRRNFLKGSAVLTVSAAGIMGKASNAGQLPGFAEKFEHHTKSFMNQYYDGILEMSRGVRKTEIEKISKAMEKAYELKQKGGRLYSHVVYGHYANFAGSRDRPGQPWLLPRCTISQRRKQLNIMKKGDFLLTSGVLPETLEAHKRGVFVVGITNNYFKFSKTPPDGLREDRMKLSFEDVSDILIDSYVPWDNGLVSAPLIPHFKLCPSSGIATYSIYWACTAVLANLIGTKGKGSGTEPAEKFLDIAYDRYRMIGTDRPKIDSVAEKWAGLVLGRKARLLVYGHPQDIEVYGGARNMFVNDAYICASSSMIADQYEKRENDLRDSDIVLIGAFTSDNKDEIRVARHARSVGAYTVAFCPYGADGDTSGVRLFKEVDAAFNSYSDERAGVISVKGFKEKVCPLAGLTGNLIHWMLTAQWTDHMARRGEMPYYWQGYHEKGGMEYDKMVKVIFDKRGY